MVLTLVIAAGTVVGAWPPDHVVVVIEENHGFSQIIGDPEAPYINSLADGGASLTTMFGITHPSQPNYLNFFSGSNQGVTTNSLPPGLPFSTPNLGASLFQAGKTFGGYSDGLPGVGSDVESFASYYRKHNPWANWQSPTPGLNQFPLAVNMPFTSFPADFTQLPTVSVVVPDQQHDMHDGTIAQADDWLASNLGAYAAWARMHNSLLIVTWDEDNSGEHNRIPTIFYGPMVRPGSVASTWSLHHLLRTLQEMYGAAPSGVAASASAMTGFWSHEPPSTTRVFRQGQDGYMSAVDTYVESLNPGVAHGADAVLVADGSPATQALLRFDSIVGATGVPAGARVLSAKVVIVTGTTSSDQTADAMRLHRMLTPWSATSTWSSLGEGGGGISADGVEAATTADFTLTPNVLDQWMVFDVTATVRAWADGSAANFGWAVLPAGTDGWRWNSSEAANPAARPYLEVTYTTCGWSGCVADYDGSGGVPDVSDVDAFFAAWLAGDACADADGSGGVPDTGDVDAFFIAWLAGGC